MSESNPNENDRRNSNERPLYALTQALGYCCPGLFLTVFPPERNAYIALRLGVSMRTVQRWRHLPLKCEQGKSCLLPRCSGKLSEAQILGLMSAQPPESSPQSAESQAPASPSTPASSPSEMPGPASLAGEPGLGSS